MHKLQRLCGILAALCVSVPTAKHVARAAATAEISEEAVDRMIDLNRKAFADIQSSRFEAARYRLEEALVIGETAGLENDEMTARSYVHLATVYLTGFKKREEAVRQFMHALRINPNITLTVGLETPALKSTYLLARKQMGLPPSPDIDPAPTSPAASGPNPTESTSMENTPPVETATSPQPAHDGASNLRGIKDPDPPARIQVPLYCPLPFEIPPGQDLVVRCLTQTQQKRSSGTLYYQREGATGEDYTTIDMGLSAKGWLVATIPGDVIHGKSLSYYVHAQIPGSKGMLSLGRPDAPNSFIIKEATGAPPHELYPSTTQQTSAATLDGGNSHLSHFRVPGAVWISMAGGSGAAYHGRETVDSNARAQSSSTPVSVHGGFSPAGLFQLESEIGYQWNERLSISVMGRYQYAPKDADGYTPRAGERGILTSAVAGFLHSQFALLTTGNFRIYASSGIGVGNSFLAVVNQQCKGTSCTLNHSDTLHGGPVGLTFGVGVIYHFDPIFGVFVDVKEIATLPKFMALTEINLGLAVTYNFEESATARKAVNRDR